MATHAKTLSSPALRREPSGGFLSQMLRVFVQPITFFKALPTGHSWRLVAILILAIAGYTATLTTGSSTTTATTTAAAAAQTGGFDLSVLNATATSATVAAVTSTGATSSTTTSSNTTLMTALVAASGVLVMWTGQAALLSLVTMFRGYSPAVGKSFQIAVWASLPLALMLVLRYVHFSTGGTGGSLGLSLLLNQWSGYATLPDYVRRVLAVFFSNLTLFWLWNLVLLYLGARYALHGRRLVVIPLVILWIVLATGVPALVSEPQTRISVIQSGTGTTTQSTTRQSTTGTTTTGQAQTGTGTTFSGAQTGGQFPGGTGGPPSGGGFPPGG